MLSSSNELVKSVTVLSPDKQHVLSIKENMQTNEMIYYRPYFGIFCPRTGETSFYSCG